MEGKGGGVSTIAVSVRKVRPFPTSKGYYCLQLTKKDFRLLGCAKKIKICAKKRDDNILNIYGRRILPFTLM